MGLIYSDIACDLLEYLAHGSNMSDFASQERLARLLGLNNREAFQRAKGTRTAGVKGWPRDYDYAKNIREALYIIALLYPGPGQFASKAYQRLRDQHGIEIESLGQLAEQLSEEGNWPKNTKVEDNKQFVDACDRIIALCDPRRSPQAANLFAADAPASILSLLHSVVRDKPCVIQIDSGPQFIWEPDGLGPIDIRMPDSEVDLVAAIIPVRCLNYLAQENKLPQEAVAARLLTPSGARQLRSQVCDYFTGDNGHRFCLMVGQAQSLLSEYCDEELLRTRCAKAFNLLASKSLRPESVQESLSSLRQYSMESPPRIIASLTLALLIGPEYYTAYRTVLEGR